MPGFLKPNPELEFKPFRLIPEDTEVYGVLTEMRVKPYSIKKGQFSGRQGYLLMSKFEILGGEYKGQTIHDTIFANVEINEELGEVKHEQVGNCSDYFKLLELAGHVGEVDGATAYMIPDSVDEFEDAFKGQHRYEGKPIRGLPICVVVRQQEKAKYDKETKSDAVDENGNTIFVTVNRIKYLKDVPEAIAGDIREAWANSDSNDEDIPW